MSRRAPILNLCKVEKNFDLLPNFWYIKDSNITSGAQRKIFEKDTIFFGHPLLSQAQNSMLCHEDNHTTHDNRTLKIRFLGVFPLYSVLCNQILL